MADTTYNGWTNWETWNVELWIDNEEPLYRAKQRFLRTYRGSINESVVQAWVHEALPKGTPDFDSIDDYLKVNWKELADHWADEAKEYE